MKNYRFSVLSVLFFSAFAAGCGTQSSETAVVDSDVAAAPVADIAPEQPVNEGTEPAVDAASEEGTREGTIVLDGAKNSDDGIAEPKVIEEGEVPQDPNAALVAEAPAEENVPEETPQEIAPPADDAEAASEPAATADPSFTPDSDLNTVYPNGKRQFQSAGFVVYQEAPQPQKTFQQAPYAYTTVDLYEETGSDVPFARIDCGRTHLPGCP
jgi:hypothetical protein